LTRLLTNWIFFAVLGALALGFGIVLYPGDRALALDIYILYLGALGLIACVQATRAAHPDVHEPSLADELADPLDVLPERPAELERLEREVYLSLGTGFYLHHRLRPLLREVAAHRLLVRHGVDMDRRPDAAAVILGDTTWSWLRPDKPEPRDRWAPGPPLSELREVVDVIERI
jgi:hypothetical protein